METKTKCQSARRVSNYRRVFFSSDVLGHRFVPQMGIPFIYAVDVSFAWYFNVAFSQYKFSNCLQKYYNEKKLHNWLFLMDEYLCMHRYIYNAL